MIAKPSLFSWFLEPMMEPEKILTWLQTHHIKRLYQFATPDYSVDDFQAFLKKAKEFDLDIYLLNGEPEWALDSTAQEMLNYLAWTRKFQGDVKGIVFDIEPYSLEEYKENPQKVMTTFVEAMVKVYAQAHTQHLEIILCLPYFYDIYGFEVELETLIKKACDGILVMNYYRGKEIEHIQTQVILCERYNKYIETIYELQPAGLFDLTDQNTYYIKGLPAAYENYKQLSKAYSEKPIELSFHELRYFTELINREEEVNEWIL